MPKGEEKPTSQYLPFNRNLHTMPSFREQTPPPLFMKSISPRSSHPTQSTYSNNTILPRNSHSTSSVFSGSTSQNPDNMIPPHYSNTNSIHSQFSNYPTPAEQNSILSQTVSFIPSNFVIPRNQHISSTVALGPIHQMLSLQRPRPQLSLSHHPRYVRRFQQEISPPTTYSQWTP